MKSSNVQPFVKWVGGKRQLLKEIFSTFEALNAEGNFHEPFVGGGAVFINKLNFGQNVSSINDLNSDLVNVYRVVKDKPNQLIKELKKFEEAHSRLMFYFIRSLDRGDELKKKSDVFKAARFIYLNKTAFNGVYRVNSQNQFNVPIGAIGKTKIYDANNIIELSRLMNESNMQIFNNDFSYVESVAKRGDLVYFDPPYDSFENETNFVGYQKGGFDQSEQIRLKQLCDRLVDKGVKVVVSNHNTKFINDLYDDKNYYIKRVVAASRVLNSKAEKRNKADIEVLIIGDKNE